MFRLGGAVIATALANSSVSAAQHPNREVEKLTAEELSNVPNPRDAGIASSLVESSVHVMDDMLTRLSLKFTHQIATEINQIPKAKREQLSPELQAKFGAIFEDYLNTCADINGITSARRNNVLDSFSLVHPLLATCRTGNPLYDEVHTFIRDVHLYISRTANQEFLDLKKLLPAPPQPGSNEGFDF